MIRRPSVRTCAPTLHAVEVAPQLFESTARVILAGHPIGQNGRRWP